MKLRAIAPLLSSWLILLFCTCQQDPPVPKPRIYPKIVWPEGQLVEMHPEGCPFKFEFPNYASIVKKRPDLLPDELTQHQCWFNLDIPAFNAELYITYKPMHSRASYDKAVADSYRIISQVNRRSDYTEETVIRNAYGVSGVKYTFEGDAASPIHFYVSDTLQHFVKGALYYRHAVHADSMMPITEQLITDIDLMLASIQWQD